MNEVWINYIIFYLALFLDGWAMMSQIVTYQAKLHDIILQFTTMEKGAVQTVPGPDIFCITSTS